MTNVRRIYQGSSCALEVVCRPTVRSQESGGGTSKVPQHVFHLLYHPTPADPLCILADQDHSLFDPTIHSVLLVLPAYLEKLISVGCPHNEVAYGSPPDTSTPGPDARSRFLDDHPPRRPMTYQHLLNHYVRRDHHDHNGSDARCLQRSSVTSPARPPVSPLSKFHLNSSPSPTKNNFSADLTPSPKDASTMPPPAISARKRKPVLLHPPSDSFSSDDRDADSPEPESKPSRRAKSSRPMSREALRKANHSLIERRRREKINFALGELRAMVPGLSGAEAKGGEFKLEVLERTVEHMRELKTRVQELEEREESGTGTGQRRKVRRSEESGSAYEPDDEAVESYGPRGSTPRVAPGPSRSHSSKKPTRPTSTPGLQPGLKTPTPPTPDPDETESEPPHLSPKLPTHSHSISPQPPSITSILSRPLAPPNAPNPTLYLPFPTPSPTSPFLTYPNTTTSSSSSGPPEPSPFLAPLTNMSLFNGALDLKSFDERDESSMSMSPNASMNLVSSKTMPPEEAANLLLAFSSPDTLRPVSSVSVMGAAYHANSNGNGGGTGAASARRSTLESEEFTLDGGVATKDVAVGMGMEVGVMGKTARDILKM